MDTQETSMQLKQIGSTCTTRGFSASIPRSLHLVILLLSRVNLLFQLTKALVEDWVNLTP